jgi:hypothetical protein
MLLANRLFHIGSIFILSPCRLAPHKTITADLSRSISIQIIPSEGCQLDGVDNLKSKLSQGSGRGYEALEYCKLFF